jgi:long-chain acyl-CoA synthetase
LAVLAARERATVLPAVPFTFELLAAARAHTDLSALRLCISAGTALPKATFDAFRARFGVPIRQLYGCSEGGALALNTSAEPARTWAAVGRGLGDTRFRILDADAEGSGEIAVASASLTRGYDGLPEANAASFGDGWFRTGDRGRLDAEGLLYVTGRRNLYIELAGHKVDPYEIEDVLVAHPAVDEAAVLGVPGQRAGDTLIKAVVVPAEPAGLEQAPTPQALRRWCAERLAAYKVPAICEWRTELPKSPLGKVLKKYLIEGPGAA